MVEHKVFLRQATTEDIDGLVALLNECYRDRVGWTNEADLVGGIRTTNAEVQKMIESEHVYLFVFPKTIEGENTDTGQVLSCISIEVNKKQRTAYIGTFAVSPSLQGQGIGHTILKAAETFGSRHICDNFNDTQQPARLMMSVLSHRPELLAYYQRRGYQLTGGSTPFPLDGNNGQPKRDGLELLTLEKLV